MSCMVSTSTSFVEVKSDKYVIRNGRAKDMGALEYVTQFKTPGGDTWNGLFVFGSTEYDYDDPTKNIAWTLSATVTGSPSYHSGKAYMKSDGTIYWDNLLPSGSSERYAPYTLTGEKTALKYNWGTYQNLPLGSYKIGYGIFDSAGPTQATHTEITNGILLHYEKNGSIDVTITDIVIKAE